MSFLHHMAFIIIFKENSTKNFNVLSFPLHYEFW